MGVPLMMVDWPGGVGRTVLGCGQIFTVRLFACSTIALGEGPATKGLSNFRTSLNPKPGPQGSQIQKAPPN